MNKLLLAVLTLAAVFTLPFTASIAAEASANAAVTSNYVFRGQTQTQDDPAVQGGYDIQLSEDKGWYAGVWGSTVDKGLEVDLYGGWRGLFGTNNKMGYDVGAILYEYTDSQYTDVTELYGSISYETAYAKVFLGNGSGISSYTYIDLGASFVVLTDMDLDLHYGHMSEGSSNDLSAALSTKVKDFDLSLGLTYEDAGANSDIEFFVTVGKEFDL